MKLPADSSSSVAVVVMVWSFRLMADTEGGDEVGDEREIGSAEAAGCVLVNESVSLFIHSHAK